MSLFTHLYVAHIFESFFSFTRSSNDDEKKNIDSITYERGGHEIIVFYNPQMKLRKKSHIYMTKNGSNKYKKQNECERAAAR